MGGFLIAAAHKSSGKTVVTTGLAGALATRGHKVQTFKKGPDYIDPMWLGAASGRPCYNLDFNTMSDDEIKALVARKTGDGIAVVEANKGLYDGVDLSGIDSNAQLAKLLNLPVILVIDTSGMTRGIAPLLMGYSAFDADVNIAGVVLNKVGGPRHEGKLRNAVETYTSIPVLGAIGRVRDVRIDERHLGLATPGEVEERDAIVATASDLVAGNVDLDRILDLAAKWTAPTAPPFASTVPAQSDVTIAVARDVAFGFYYQDDLETFERLGARLSFFDATRDERLPDADGLFIGGGFPEMAMPALSANNALRDDIRARIEAGLPTYAECGGLMYLCRDISWQGNTSHMCGVIDASAVMHNRPQGRGYLQFTPNADHPWDVPATRTKAHEFHYASLEGLPDDTRFALDINRGHGTNGTSDGIVKHNLLAGFAHQRHTDANPWIERFLNFVRRRNVP